MKLSKFILALFFSLMFVCAHAANIDFHDSQGKVIKSSDFKGKWVIINYWASWCDICLREVPEFNKLYKNNKDKNILIFGVNYDHLTSDDLATAMANADIHYPVLIEDPTSMWNFGYFDVVPVTFVINPQGKIAERIVGPTTEYALMNIIHSAKSSS